MKLMSDLPDHFLATVDTGQLGAMKSLNDELESTAEFASTPPGMSMRGASDRSALGYRHVGGTTSEATAI